MPFYDFARVTDPADRTGVAFTVRADRVPAGCEVLDDLPATRPDGTPLPPAPLPKKKKHNPAGQEADPEKETD